MDSRAYRWAVTLPPVLWVTLLLLLPYSMMALYSLWKVESGVIVHEVGLGNYLRLLSNPMYLQVLLRSAAIAAAVTVLSLLLAYPLAYSLSFRAGPRKELLYQLVILPLWVSYLVRGYAWKTILGSQGVLNSFLLHFGLIQEPLSFLLYSPFAVVVTLTHIYTPFTFLPLYAAMEAIPRPLVEASQDLGASPAVTFRRVILPLTLPGLVTGATFSFVLSLGDFLAPNLVGGASGIMISNVVQSLFGTAYDWPMGAAISLVMLALVMLLLTVTERLQRRWSHL